MKTPSEPRTSEHRAEQNKPSSKQPSGAYAPNPAGADSGRTNKSVRGKAARPVNGKAATTHAASTKATPAKTARAPQGRSKLQLPIVNNAKPSGKSFGCAECGLCCTYVAIEIDGPTTVKRATELLWYLYHDGVSLYLNDDAWMVQFETTCRYLTADRRCGVYATRPHICREFSEQDCEVNTGDDGQTFYNATAFVEYLKQAKPRVHALVMKGYAPPDETQRPANPFEGRLRDVYVRRAAALSPPVRQSAPAPQPRAASRPVLPVKKSRGSSASTDTL
jgi:Fe-S-cluster containining protein